MILGERIDCDVLAILKEDALLVEDYLSRHCATENGDLSTLFDAMRYSLLGGGKRIRPFLVLETARMLGVDKQAALPYAAALEMIHTYSLIHDDLPAMDNDDYRRGRLTNHKKFGEATAILAGDGLLTHAFYVTTLGSDPQKNAAAVRVLAECAGPCGMVGGQAMDLAAEGRKIDFKTLQSIHRLKTGALIRAAVSLGAISASAKEKELDALTEYAEKVGQVFQLVDDVLDRFGDASKLGKTLGKDEKAGKNTYLSFFSKQEALDYAEKLTEQAISAVSPWDKSGILKAFAYYMLIREN